MAVYTQLTTLDIESFLAQYNIGELVSFEPIAEGVTNTNYLLKVGVEKYILTLFENHYKLEELPYFTALMAWWHARGISCPQPITTRDGRTLSALSERPALLVSFLEGGAIKTITPDHMSAIGALAANMHIAGMEFPHRRANHLSVKGWEALIDKIIVRADDIEPGLKQLINEEYNYLSENWPDALPSGPIHADLFPDNVFFTKAFGKKPELSGVIDLYFACHDFWAYDLAIIVNAWCFDDKQKLVNERVQALMTGYNDIRAMTPEEEASFPLLLRGAALRFLLTRAHDKLFPAEGAIITPKDPLEYARKLEFFRG